MERFHVNVHGHVREQFKLDLTMVGIVDFRC